MSVVSDLFTTDVIVFGSKTERFEVSAHLDYVSVKITNQAGVITDSDLNF